MLDKHRESFALSVESHALPKDFFAEALSFMFERSAPETVEQCVGSLRQLLLARSDGDYPPGGTLGKIVCYREQVSAEDEGNAKNYGMESTVCTLSIETRPCHAIIFGSAHSEESHCLSLAMSRMVKVDDSFSQADLRAMFDENK